MYCSNCGKEIDGKAFVCPHCGVKQNIVSEDGPVGGLGIICFLIPLVGLILYLIWKDIKPIKSKGAGKSALWGFIVLIILNAIIIANAVAPGIAVQASNSNRIVLEADLNNLAASAHAFYKTPATHSGGGNSWSSNVDNVGVWLDYDYNTSTNTLTTENGSFHLYVNQETLTIKGTGLKIGNDSTNAVQVTIEITGPYMDISTTINN